MPKLVETLFNRYIENVYKGQSMAPGQLEELRKCFFAAVWATLHEVGEVSSQLPEAQAILVWDGMQRECLAVSKDVLDKWYKSN